MQLNISEGVDRIKIAQQATKKAGKSKCKRVRACVYIQDTRLFFSVIFVNTCYFYETANSYGSHSRMHVS